MNGTRKMIRLFSMIALLCILVGAMSGTVLAMDKADYVGPANISTGLSWDGKTPIVYTYTDGSTGTTPKVGATYESRPGITSTVKERDLDTNDGETRPHASEIVFICSGCGRAVGDGTKGTCLHWLSGGNHTCPNCRKTVPGKTCHTCKNTALKVKAINVASSGKVKLTWNALPGAAEYRIFRSTSKNGTYKLMYTTSKTHYTNTAATAGKYYYYYVEAVAVKGVEVAFKTSNTVGRTCDLPQPTVTASNDAATGNVKLSWTRVSGAVKYEVYRSTSRGGTYKLISTTTKTSVTNTRNVTHGKTYYYKVKAIAAKEAANSAFSEVESRTCDLARPVATVKLNTKGKPVVDWKNIEGATAYKVYIYNTKGKLLKTVTVTNSKFTHSSAVGGKTYNYRVVALAAKSSGNSAKSTKCSIMAGYTMDEKDYVKPADVSTGKSWDGKTPIVYTYEDGSTGTTPKVGAIYEKKPGCPRVVTEVDLGTMTKEEYFGGADDGYCNYCGKETGDGSDGTCVRWSLVDGDHECPSCGETVPEHTCHTCDED